jgi:hypothetical protein
VSTPGSVGLLLKSSNLWSSDCVLQLAPTFLRRNMFACFSPSTVLCVVYFLWVL